MWIPDDDVKAWIREKYTYDETTGVVSDRRSGKPRGSISTQGYCVIKLWKVSMNLSKEVQVAKLAHFLVYDVWPSNVIDHVDHDKLDNRIEKLRPASNSENSQNRLKQQQRSGKKTTSSYKGVHWNAHAKKWRAQITLGGVVRHLGSFAVEEAAKALRNSRCDVVWRFRVR